MGLLDRDSKILMDNKNKESANSSEGVDASKKSKRTVGGQGLRRFGTLDKFNANIKPKTIETPTVEEKVVEVPQHEFQAVPIKQEPAVQAIPVQAQIAPVVEEPKVVVTQVVSASPITQNEPKESNAHVITSEIPRQPTVNTTTTPQQLHVKATDSTRNNHDIDHVKTHAERGFQRSHLVDESIIYNIHSLPKYHRVIVEFMFSKCSQTGTNKTSHIFTNEILGITGMKSRTYEDALARLIEDKILTVIDVRKGRSGFRTFEIHSNIFAQLIQESRNPNKYHVNHHVENHGFPPSKEVSKFNNNITNYTQTPNVVIPKNFNFKDLDFTEVAPLHWTQVNSSIRKQVEEKFEKEEMQLFIDKFMVWMSTQKNVQSVIGLFCAKIKEYLEEGDSPVMQCLSKKELEAEKEFRQKAEQLAQQQAIVNKFNQEVASKAIDEKFEIWLNGLTDEKKLLIAPLDKKGFMKLGDVAHTASLKNYFKECIFVG